MELVGITVWDGMGWAGRGIIGKGKDGQGSLLERSGIYPPPHVPLGQTADAATLTFVFASPVGSPCS